MSIRSILKMGESSLLQPSTEIKDFAKENIPELIQDMTDTLRAESGIGLAAPQIGVNKRMIVFGGRDESIQLTVLINPKIVPLSEEKEIAFEACMSLPDLMGAVARHKHIRYSGLDEHGNHFEKEVEGYHARVVQHETDHLDGILYVMRLENLAYFGYRDVIMEQYAKQKS